MSVGIAVIVLLAIYFAPAIVASNRKHQSATAIFVLNLFLGWTFLGWVIALVWACTGNTRSNAENQAVMVAHLIQNGALPGQSLQREPRPPEPGAAEMAAFYAAKRQMLEDEKSAKRR